MSPSNRAFGVRKTETHMSTHTFIRLNQTRILNIDGCLTDQANVTVKREDGKLEFYYFENGELVGSKTNDPKW
jgi:hypothetical protein